MQSCSTSSSLILNIVSISLLLLVSIASDNLLKSICDKSQNPSECEIAFSQDLRSKTAGTPRELANICLDLAVANTTKCVESVIDLQTRNTTPPAWKPALQTCVQQLNISAGEFRMAKVDLTEDAQSASYDVMLSMDGAQMCDDALKKDDVNLPQVNAYGDNIRFFARIAAPIIDLVQP